MQTNLKDVFVELLPTLTGVVMFGAGFYFAVATSQWILVEVEAMRQTDVVPHVGHVIGGHEDDAATR
ncbi:MAG: hypothetical protein LBJ59_07380 [Zoogloeaceae bacterium]|jgi:hypothetical protein|nr:hypothetical protein [Zoogloeaceae bacterium]